MQEEMWRNLINGLPELPTDGEDAPAMENIKETPVRDGESPVTLQKIVTEIYVYTSLNDTDLYYGTKSFQDVQLLGNMRLSEAMKIINAPRKRRRRRNS